MAGSVAVELNWHTSHSRSTPFKLLSWLLSMVHRSYEDVESSPPKHRPDSRNQPVYSSNSEIDSALVPQNMDWNNTTLVAWKDSAQKSELPVPALSSTPTSASLLSCFPLFFRNAAGARPTVVYKDTSLYGSCSALSINQTHSPRQGRVDSACCQWSLYSQDS